MGGRIPGDYCLGPCASGRGPYAQNVLECLLLFLVGVFERGHELGSFGQDFGGRCHQAADVDVAADAGRAGTNGRGELQGAHATACPGNRAVQRR